MKWINFTIGSVVLVAAAVFTAIKFGSLEVQQLQAQVSQLEQQRQQLLDYAQRLSATRRVAQVDVVRTRQDRHGRQVSTLLWQEIGGDGTLGQPVAVEAIGTLVYFEALVIKFAHHHVQEGDPQRGTSLAMFRRIFGDHQAPDTVPELDRAARPPTVEDEQTATLHQELWSLFWEMIDNPELAARYGVRVVQCEAPAVPLRAGQIWEVALDAAGGLNLRRIGSRTAQVGEIDRSRGLEDPP
ncbi:MAG: hypothetical protein ABIG44_08430 [Planctomycetota bacterium]